MLREPSGLESSSGAAEPCRDSERSGVAESMTHASPDAPSARLMRPLPPFSHATCAADDGLFAGLPDLAAMLGRSAPHALQEELGAPLEGSAQVGDASADADAAPAPEP